MVRDSLLTPTFPVVIKHVFIRGNSNEGYNLCLGREGSDSFLT